MRHERPVDPVRTGRRSKRRMFRSAGTEHAKKRINKELRLLKSILCHDILNQLTALHGLLALSELEETTPEIREYIRKEQRIAETLQAQILFMRDFPETGMKQPVWQNLDTILQRVIDKIPLSPEIRVNYRSDRIEISADPLFECVFYNLIVNSLMHGKWASTITIHAEETTPGPGLGVIYEDNGCGVDAPVKEKIFLKGYGKNTGLGLYLIRELLSIKGITIVENGEPGVGARFVIHVPQGLYRVAENPGG